MRSNEALVYFRCATIPRRQRDACPDERIASAAHRINEVGRRRKQGPTQFEHFLNRPSCVAWVRDDSPPNRVAPDIFAPIYAPDKSHNGQKEER